MEELIETLRGLLLGELGLNLLKGLFFFLVGILLARIASQTSDRLLRSHSTIQQRILFRRAISYGIVAVFTLAALKTAGLDLSVLLGAAGILTVALGFASQASVSNVISGLFLLGENAFSVGDTIRVEDVVGEVVSVDLLSVKMRTFDNLLVRLPNESLLKLRITNLTRFPIRRLDLPLWIAVDEDPEKVRETLFEVAARNPLCLDEPGPTLFHHGFGDAGAHLQISMWAHRDRFLEFRNSVPNEIQVAFSEAKIRFGAPRRSVWIQPGEQLAEIVPESDPTASPSS